MAATIEVSSEQMSALAAALVDTESTLAARFRALFTLKNINGDAAVDGPSATFFFFSRGFN